MTTSVDRPVALIETLGLVAHPEGGYYSEVYRSSLSVKPSDERDQRPSLTTIYFLLPAGQVSRWHRVQSDEVWHFYEGDPLELWLTPPDLGRIDDQRIGPVGPGQQPVVVVPAGWWQAARPVGTYSLVGCTVAPGFDFSDFTLASAQPDVASRLRSHGPGAAALV